MAKTPFSTASVTTAGAAPGRRARDSAPGLRRYWLGRPGNLIQLQGVKTGTSSAPSSGESVHTSLGGVTTTFRRPDVKRQFPLTFERMTGRDWQVFYGFYRRAFGPGPWAYFPPEDVNRLDEVVSLCQDVTAWSELGAGVITALGQATSPVLPSGVLKWAGAAAGDILVARPMLAGSSTLPSVAGACPYLPGEPFTFSAWLWVASGTRTVKLRLSGRDAASVVATEVDGATVTLTTTPQLVSATIAAGTLGASLYVVPEVVAVGATVVDIQIAAPQLEVWSAATDWCLGVGVPRVTWGPAPGRDLDARYRSTATMNLAE
jgi:hypothetical protein